MDGNETPPAVDTVRPLSKFTRDGTIDVETAQLTFTIDNLDEACSVSRSPSSKLPRSQYKCLRFSVRFNAESRWSAV